MISPLENVTHNALNTSIIISLLNDHIVMGEWFSTSFGRSNAKRKWDDGCPWEVVEKGAKEKVKKEKVRREELVFDRNCHQLPTRRTESKSFD
jgi:hypothetical protein